MNIKKLTFILLSVLVCGSLLAQCPTGNVMLATQEEINEFAMLYPNCTNIIDGLMIGGSPSTHVTDISPLSQITSIEGSLLIEVNDSLINLSGLDNVTSVGNKLSIANNSNLASLSGLENLISVGGDFHFINNESLTTLSGLDNLTSIGGELLVLESETLLNLNGLDNLTSIGSLRLWLNDNLLSLSALSNLTSIGSDLDIYENDALVDLNGLDDLSLFSGHLGISFNDNLTTLNALRTIEPGSVASMRIDYNQLLSVCNTPCICTLLMEGGFADISDNAPNCNTSEEILALCTVPTIMPEDLPQVTISPNPNTGTFTLQNIPTGTYQIHNTAGQIIQTGNMQNDLLIDISREVQGVYFMSITVDEATLVRRVVKM